MKTLVILAAAAAMCLTACHRNAALPTTAQAFANAAASSDRFEIESSRMAATSAQSASVKSFARQMITAHTARHSLSLPAATTREPSRAANA